MLQMEAWQIMNRDVITIKKGASVEEALKLMTKHHVSGLPVVDADGCIVGIITESDVLLKDQAHVLDKPRPIKGHPPVPEEVLEKAYKKARAELVEDAMTKDVIAFSEDSIVADIARVMVELGINRVPVVRDRKVVGIISRADIIKAMAATLAPPAADAAKPKKKREPIELG